MGVDACIYVKASNDIAELLPDDYDPAMVSIIKSDGFITGSTHEIQQHWRYYGPGYERGPWPLISSVLITLLASPRVDKVWYFSDHDDKETIKHFSVAKLMVITKHYLLNEHRPYLDKFKRSIYE